MEIIKLEKENTQDVVKKAVNVLIDGGLIVYPTETCYGIGVDATNQQAVNKLLKFKKRPVGKAISVAISDIEMAKSYVDINPEAKNIYDNFLPGPVTVISELKQGSNVAQGLASEHNTLGVRIPDYNLVREIVKKLGKPMTATSANIASLPSPYSLLQWQKQTAKKSQEMIDLFIDGGKLPLRPPSTVVDTTKSTLSVVRSGEMFISNPDLEVMSNSSQETEEIAYKWTLELIKKYREKAIVMGLCGDMGSGKTHFAKGVGRAMGVGENIVSPTFTIMDEYKIECGFFVQIDTWRMESVEEVEELELENYCMAGNLMVIEWADKFKSYWESSAKAEIFKLVWIEIETKGLNSRIIKLREEEIN